MLIRLQRIYNFCLFHAVILSFLDVLQSFYSKSLQTIDLVWPTRLVVLAMGEVLSFGFNLAVLDPSDRRGIGTYCIVAIKGNKMGFSSYCLSLSRYIMSSYLMCYSVLMNLIF